MLVLDCSVTMAWLYEDEATDYTESVLNALASGERAAAPSLWALEVSNVLVIGERRNRNSQAQTRGFWETLKGLPIEIDEHTTEHASEATLSLARSYTLSIYDASYLELASRLSAALATLDKRLVNAATACGVPLWKPSSTMRIEP